ncbi:unnamed protein product, partial [Larinioides sclopetarius]
QEKSFAAEAGWNIHLWRPTEIIGAGRSLTLQQFFFGCSRRSLLQQKLGGTYTSGDPQKLLAPADLERYSSFFF